MEKTQDDPKAQQGDQAAVAGGTPKVGEQGTQKKEPKVYKAEEVQSLLADQAKTFNSDIKTVKDKLADQGRLQKTIETLQSEVDELRGTKNDPDLSAAARQRAKDEIATLSQQIAAAKAELGDVEGRKAASQQEKTLVAIAGKATVDPGELRAYVEEKTGMSAASCSEKMLTFFAETMAENKAAEKDVKGLKIDSGLGGGVPKLRTNTERLEEAKTKK
jgi:FtsZ-binding cell division protein ZapB